VCVSFRYIHLLLYMCFVCYRVGLIEWVADTIPLKDFILHSLTDQERKFFSDK